MRTAQETERKAQHVEHAVRSARAFNRACQLTGLSSSELCRRLSPLTGRTTLLSRQTLAAWRHGKSPVPMVAFLAACELAGMRPPMVFELSVDA